MAVPTITLTGRGFTGLDPELLPPTKGVKTLTVCLGRKPPRRAKKAPRLADYLETGGTPPPDTFDLGAKAQTSIAHMYANDRLGDCVLAGKHHSLGLWSGNDAPNQVVLATDQEVVDAYHRICGAGDNGCVITDVLDAFKSGGLMAGGQAHKIDGYVAVDWPDKLQTMVAMYLFGPLTIGVNLPQAWTSSDIWDVTNSQIVGGHDVCTVGYDAQGVTIASWGRTYKITWAAWTSRKWLEECWALLAPDWYGSDRIGATGVNLDKLKADLDLLGGGTTPPLDPTPGPTPPPGPPPTPGPGPVWAWILAFIAWLKSLLGGHNLPNGVTAGDILDIVINLAELMGLIADDIAAGKSFLQILLDCLAYLNPAHPALELYRR